MRRLAREQLLWFVAFSPSSSPASSQVIEILSLSFGHQGVWRWGHERSTCERETHGDPSQRVNRLIAFSWYRLGDSTSRGSGVGRIGVQHEGDVLTHGTDRRDIEGFFPYFFFLDS